MPLPDDYLRYNARRHGMDQDRHGWAPVAGRPPVHLDCGAKALGFIVVPIEFFPLNPPKAPFAHPGAMKTPYPDLRHYTTRDYGNRVGVYRILRALDKAGLKATFAINAIVAERYPPLIEAIERAGHEIAAHGLSTAHIHHEGLSEGGERELFETVRARMPHAVTWMSPARNQSFRTLDLIQEFGFKNCLDWEADQQPFRLNAKDGRVTGLPLMNELNDFTLLIDRRQHEDEWSTQIIEAAALHVHEHELKGAQTFGFTLTPHISGQPFRIAAVRRTLLTLSKMNGFSVMSARDVADAFKRASGTNNQSHRG